MADYPPDPSYGMNYGAPNNNYMSTSYNQQQQQQPDRRLLSNPTAYPPPPNGQDSFAAYNMANAQFNTNLPAFPMPFPPPPFAPGTNLNTNGSGYPMQPAWNGASGFPSNPMSWPQPPFNFTPNATTQYGLPRLDTNTQQHVPPQQIDKPTPHVEEGELSEGEFQDNYKGKQRKSFGDANKSVSGAHQQSRTNSNAYQNHATSRTTAFKDANGGAGPANGRRNVQSGRRQTDNYTPNGSPRQGNANARGNKNRRKTRNGKKSTSPYPARDSYRPAQQSQTNANESVNQPSPMDNQANPAPNALTKTGVEDLHDIPDDDRYSPQLEQPATPATPDKRVLAQHAILNLMAAKVTFKDYVDEGIDESVVQALFDSLGMPQTRSKAGQEAVSLQQGPDGKVPNGQVKEIVKPTTNQPNQAPPATSSADLLNHKNSLHRDSLQSGQQASNRKDSLQSAVSPTTNSTVPKTNAPAANGEERKDRIARLLAEKQKKQTTAAQPSTNSAVSSATSQAAAVKAEKDRLLNLKIENLRKSREARTLKNDAAKAAAAPVSGETKSTPVTPVSPFQPTIIQSPQISQLQKDLPSRASPVSTSRSDLQPGVVHSSVYNNAPLPIPASLPPKPTASPSPFPASLPPKPTASPSPFPAIPGLFLSAAAPTTSTTANGTVPPPNARKRPVAADFDEPMPSTAYKRPFGQNRVDTPLVIDVSDDESSDGDEGSAMDLDLPESGHDSAGSIKAGRTRSQAPSVDQESRQPTAQPTPVQSHVKPPPDELKSKLDQIAELHKKIAEAEKKKKAKADAMRSGSQTPLTTEVANAQQNLVNEAIAEKNKASAELERLLEVASTEAQKSLDDHVKEQNDSSEIKKRDVERQRMQRASIEAQKSSDGHEKEQGNPSETKKEDVERKKKRRSEIQLGLPDVDAVVEKNRKRMEAARAEMEQAEAEIKRALENKQMMESEMAKLGDESEEDQLQVEQTQQLDLAVRATPSSRATPQPDSDPAPQGSSTATLSKDSQSLQNSTSNEEQANPTEVASPSPQSEDVDMLEAISPRQEPNGIAGGKDDHPALEDTISSVLEVAPSKSDDPMVTPPTAIPEKAQESVLTSDELPRAQSPMSVSADQVLEAALQQASAQAEAESHTIQSPADITDLYAPDPNKLEPTSSPHENQTSGEVQDVPNAEASVQDTIMEEAAAEGDSDAHEPQSNGVADPSKVKVKVSNLPYDLTEDKLKELFEAYEPRLVTMAFRPIPKFMVERHQARNEPRKNLGFGFVTLASAEQQQKAINEMNGKQIGRRGIAVEAFIDNPDKMHKHSAALAGEGATGDGNEGYSPPEAPAPSVPGDDPMSSISSPFSPAAAEVGPEHPPKEQAPKYVSNMPSTNRWNMGSAEPLGSTVAKKGLQVNTQGGYLLSQPSTFTPYESPLKGFSSYRLNKNFTEEVAGGFRSQTYSHRIDPMKIFCPFETAGGSCNDANCEYQHFKDLNLADDLILLQLGDSESFSNRPDIKDSFVTGLRSVLQDLKARKIRDFPTIASEIAAFRAKFNVENLDI